MSFISEQLESRIGRRQLLQWSSVAGASLLTGGILAGCGGDNCGGNGNSGGGSLATDRAVLNFALNLEYLEAEYYLRAVTGEGLATSDIGTNPGAVTTKSTSTVVPGLSTPIRQYALEIASDEQNHVRFLRTALSSFAVARPAIDLLNSFNAAFAAATNTPGATFDPFADETSFLLGAFIFEDVGVTAYKGAARLLSNKDYLEAAAGILAVEAYHAGSIRTSILAAGGSAPSSADKISAARASLGGGADQGVSVTDPSYNGVAPLTSASTTNLVPADNNSIAFSRTTAQVLNIVYLGGAAGTGGGFFPSGLNGAIR